MGRFSIYNRIKPDSRSKKERIRREEEARRERAKTYTTQQIALKGLLQGYAIDVLEAAAKGHSVDEHEYMEKITGVLNYDNRNN